MSRLMAKFKEALPPPIPHHSKPGRDEVRKPSVNTRSVKYTNAVYYPNYRVYRGETPATLNYSCISHVFYAFAHVAEDGRVLVSNLRR